jgi:uncharacterized membrane protein
LETEDKTETLLDDEIGEESPLQIPTIEEIERTIVKPAEEPVEESAFFTAITSFFKTNLLAKIGAILIFLGVVFLLSLLWDKISAF